MLHANYVAIVWHIQIIYKSFKNEYLFMCFYSNWHTTLVVNLNSKSDKKRRNLQFQDFFTFVQMSIISKPPYTICLVWFTLILTVFMF